MKINSRLFPIMGIIAAVAPAVASDLKLPKVEILGKEYYYHEIGKGESIYGIARKYDWDLEELVRLNPTTASEMKKGTRLYYPTGMVTVVTEKSTAAAPAAADATDEPIQHKVKKGESVYGIAKKYNIPLETIYALYPDAKYGLKAGEVLTFPQNASTSSDKYLFYVIKPGDTLYSIAQRYQCSVEDLLRANPGVSERNFRIGDTMRVALNSDSRRLHTELVEEERLASIDSYKVKKNDTWKSISKKTGVDVETLKEANENTRMPEKDEVINVPLIETVQVEKEYKEEDPRELTSDGIQEIYDSVHQVDSDVKQLAEVKIALLLDDPTSKKDLDFSRGMLLAIDEMKDAPYKIGFKVIDGRGATNVVTSELDSFEPDVLVATADKAFPAFLADYGETNNIEIVNAFDVRNDLYEDNPSMVQILPPSAYFNDQVSDRIVSDYGDRDILFVGIADENDAIAEMLKKQFGDRAKNLSVASLHDYTVSDNGRYLIYAYPQKKEDVQEILNNVSKLRDDAPIADITVVGRPSWVTLTENFRDKYNDAEIIIPTRCWLDVESDEGKAFVENFTEMFDGAPVRSFPNFAASGYDIARYFIDTTAKNGGDFNRSLRTTTKGVQSDFRLERVSNWGGFLNTIGYILKFRPSGYVEKELLKD